MNCKKLDHMDRWARNARLYETLKAQGLYVEPIYGEGEHGDIEYLHVSVTKIQSQQDQG